MADSSLPIAARAAAILQGRWENDALRHFVPNERQQMFLDCTKSEAAILGANRSGKSDALAALVASTARFGNPNPRFAYSSGGRLAIADRAMAIWVVGLTEKLMKEGIQPKLVRTAYTAAETHPAFIPDVEIEGANINDQTWRLKNGSFITFKTADAGPSVFQSTARDLIAFDEICAYDVYKEASMRVAAGRRLLIRLAATLLPPPGMPGGVSWYFPQKIKPWWKAGNKENTPNAQNPDKFLEIFSMGLRHNSHIPLEEIERMESLYAPDDPEGRIRINGELLETIGGVRAYPYYNQGIHFDAKITPENRDYRTPLLLCVDFNVTPCVWEIAQIIDGVWYVFDEIRMDNCDIPSMVRMFRERYPHHGAEVRIYGDWSGKARSPQSGKSNYYIMAEEFKGYPAPVRQYIPEKGNPPIKDRLNAVNRQLIGPNGRVGLVIGPACVELDADFSEVQKANDGTIKKSKKADDPYFMRTHSSDALGYGIAYVNPVPQFIAGERKAFSFPQPGYLGKGGTRGMQRAGDPPPGYTEGRLRFSGGRGVMPPRRP